MIKRIFSFLILLCMLPAGMGYIGINGNTTQAEGISASRWYNYDRSSYFGIRVGLNVPRFYCRGFNPGPETRPLSLINAGIVYGNRVGRTIPLYFETGLLYSEKGAKLEATKDIERKTYNLKYLELPIVFKYKADVGFDDLTIQPYFGGFIACGVGGNVKLYEQRIKENPFSDKYDLISFISLDTVFPVTEYSSANCFTDTNSPLSSLKNISKILYFLSGNSINKHLAHILI